MTASHAGGCPARMQGLPETLCFRPSARQPASRGAYRSVFRWCFRILPRWLSVVVRPPCEPQGTDRQTGAASRCSPSSNHTGAVMSTVRQRWLSAAAAVLAILGLGVNHARAEDTIKIGILHSLSGTMAISETILKD